MGRTKHFGVKTGRIEGIMSAFLRLGVVVSEKESEMEGGSELRIVFGGTDACLIFEKAGLSLQ